MLLKKWFIASGIAAMLAVSGLLTLPALLADDQKAAAKEQTPAVQQPEVQTFTGRVVGVHAYLAHNMMDATDAKSEHKGLLGFLAPESPIALVVKETSLVKELMPGKTTYLVVFDPQDSRSKDAYASIREMVWKDVSISGRIYDKNGLHAIEIVGVHDLPTAAKTSDQPAPAAAEAH